MNDSFAWLRPLLFLAAALFVGAVAVRTISEAARDRHRVETWLRNAMTEPNVGRESRCSCPRREPASAPVTNSLPDGCEGSKKEARVDADRRPRKFALPD